MRLVIACCLGLVLPAATLAAEPTLKDARSRWLHGNYEEARAAYEELAKAPKAPAAVYVGLSRSWQSVGEYDKALDVLADALKASPNDTDLLARQAELLYFRGRWDDASKSAERALA